MQDETQGDEQRRPRQIADHCCGAVGEAFADHFRVADDALALALLGIHLGPHHRLEQRPAQAGLEHDAGADQNAGPRIFEHAVEQHDDERDGRQHRQRHQVAAVEDAVIDLHRVDRRHQDCGVDEEAQDQGRRQGGQGCPDGVRKGRFVFRHDRAPRVCVAEPKLGEKENGGCDGQHSGGDGIAAWCGCRRRVNGSNGPAAGR